VGKTGTETAALFLEIVLSRRGTAAARLSNGASSECTASPHPPPLHVRA
jgi:hypothetical protein